MLKPEKDNPFNEIRGSDFLKLPLPFIMVLFTFLVVGAFIVKMGPVSGAVIVALIIVGVYLYYQFMYPKLGLFALLIFNYFILGVGRYVSNFPIPLGMFVDLSLVIVLLSLFFKAFFKDVGWQKAKGDLFVLCIIWFGWVLFQLVNPFAIARMAWFYSMRNIGLYLILTVPLFLILFDKHKDLHTYFKLWAIFTIIGAVKGIIQKFVGLDPFEDAWVHGPDSVTHILHGKIRYFSFFTDAGQYGASMGHSGVVFAILALGQEKSKKLKYFYAITAVLALYGMMISGTRGAMFVPVGGLVLFVIVKRNIKMMILGGLVGLSVLIFFKYTFIGQSNYTIARMRTAFNPSQDASMQVRLANQRYLKKVMRSYPIGGGIGATGPIAEKVAHSHPISKTPPDSWFVLVWMEHGIIGLALHLFILFYVVIKSSYVIMFKLKDPWLKSQMSALVSGMFGIMVASYGNAVLGQMPTVILIYSTMAFLFLGPVYDREIAEKENRRVTH